MRRDPRRRDACLEEAEPWRETIEGFLDAVGEGDVAGAAEYCVGDFSDLSLYLEPGVRRG